jgi:hypothetical protein
MKEFYAEIDDHLKEYESGTITIFTVAGAFYTYIIARFESTPADLLNG